MGQWVCGGRIELNRDKSKLTHKLLSEYTTVTEREELKLMIKKYSPYINDKKFGELFNTLYKSNNEKDRKFAENLPLIFLICDIDYIPYSKRYGHYMFEWGCIKTIVFPDDITIHDFKERALAVPAYYQTASLKIEVIVPEAFYIKLNEDPDIQKWLFGFMSQDVITIKSSGK